MLRLILKHSSRYFKGSLLLLPPISWFVVSGSSYAITQFAGSLGGMISSTASQGAREAVEGNVSFDNQNFANRTTSSVSIGQQTLGPRVSFGQSLETGSMGFTHDPTTGHGHVVQNVSQLKSTISANDNWAASVNDELVSSQAATKEYRKSFEEANAHHVQNALSLVDQASKGNVAISSLSVQENREAQNLFEEAFHAGGSYSGEHVLGRETSSKNSLEAHVKGEFSLLKLLGINIGGGLSHETSASATNNEIAKLTKDMGWSGQKKATFTKALHGIRSGNVEGRDEASQQTAKEYRSSLEKTKNSSQALSANLAYVENLQAAHSMMARGEIGLNSNLNDEVLDHIAHSRFEGHKSTAAQWAVHHDSEWKKEALSYAHGKSETFFQKLKNTKTLSKDQISEAFEAASSIIDQRKVDFQHPSDLQEKVFSLSQKVDRTLLTEKMKLSSQFRVLGSDYERTRSNFENDIVSQGHTLKNRYENEKGSSTFVRAGKSTIGIDSTLGDVGVSPFEDQVVRAAQRSSLKRSQKEIKRELEKLKGGKK